MRHALRRDLVEREAHPLEALRVHQHEARRCARGRRAGAATAKPFHTGASSARVPSTKLIRPVMRCSERNARALPRACRAGGRPPPPAPARPRPARSSGALDLLRLRRAGVLARGVEEGDDHRRAAQRAHGHALAVLVGEREVGRAQPAGRVAPSKRRGPERGRLVLGAAGRSRQGDATTARAMPTEGQTPGSIRARAEFTPPQAESLGLDEAAADRVAHQLHAVAHPELRQHVRRGGTPRSSRTACSASAIWRLVWASAISFTHLQLARGQLVRRLGAAILEPLRASASAGCAS